jgi:hypothetical protein
MHHVDSHVSRIKVSEVPREGMMTLMANVCIVIISTLFAAFSLPSTTMYYGQPFESSLDSDSISLVIPAEGCGLCLHTTQTGLSASLWRRLPFSAFSHGNPTRRDERSARLPNGTGCVYASLSRFPLSNDRHQGGNLSQVEVDPAWGGDHTVGSVDAAA